MNYKPIIIVAGEPNSVFFEIFFKCLKKNYFKSPLVIIASYELLNKQMKKLDFKFQVNLINENSLSLHKLNNKRINVINVNYNFKKPFENPSQKSNKYITECFALALRIMKKNNFLKFINGPVIKKNFLKQKFLGITEYLANKTNKKDVVMLIYNKKLSVSPITTHLPLQNVHKNISRVKIINHIKLIKEFYKKTFKINPNIAITGLNPHCESNFKSSEEERIIKPAINALIKKKYKVSGPFAADTIFIKEQSKRFDVIIGMYHDQVLTPVKTLFGFEAINITLGLPFVRISPDHGPNISMLGKNLSNPISLLKALKFLDK